MTKRIGVVAVFLVGCATGGISSQLAVPRASAQQAAGPTKWQVRCMQGKDWDDFTTFANQAGEQGFELVGYSYSDQSACFKRPKL